MNGLTLDQVKRAGLPATWSGTINEHDYIADYLPENPPESCVRVGMIPPWHGCTFGPGGDPVRDGWRHVNGCGCELCRQVAP